MREIKVLLFISVTMIASLFAGDSTGTVYIVCGSDASIWNGLSISRYDGRLFDSDVYSSPEGNGYAVMDTAFRFSLRDSFGTPLKMTWWMMAGNVFHLSNNCDVPVRNNISLYQMKKYHKNAIELYHDVLSLHYHNYYWSDTDNDGISYWNQGLDFRLNQDDFEECCMKFLIEDHVFPVSFRSGWHYMDNYYQAYMDRFIPFQMGSAYPCHGGDYDEPTNNIIDWSQAPGEFEPYHPSPDNYQLEGNCPGWQLRSVYFTGLNYTKKSLEICFSQAAQGKDQMICLWSHIPEEIFVGNLDSLNRYANTFSQEYDVDFKYCNDAEAMRLWMNSADTIAPNITLTEIVEPAGIRYRICSDGPIFQSQEPFVACKTIYETYERLDCMITAENSWETIHPVLSKNIAKIAVAVCDSVGNQSKEYIDYFSNDIYVDDSDSNSITFSGTWEQVEDSKHVFWDLNAVQATGSASYTVQPHIAESGKYGVFFHAPQSTADSLRCIVSGSSASDTVYINSPLLGSNSWQQLGFFDLHEGDGNSIFVENLSDNKILSLDVMRITPLVATKKLLLSTNEINCGEVSVKDTLIKYLILKNQGSETIHIESIQHYGDHLQISDEFSRTIPPLENDTLELVFYTDDFMEYNDVIVLRSDDALEPVKLIHYQADATGFFKRVDNEDDTYHENGNWAYSNVNAWGNTSRYSSLIKGRYADFKTELIYPGTYDLQYIVPKTVNATDHASYIVIIDGTAVDTVIVNQNTDSGSFVSIGEYELPADTEICVRIAYLGGNTIAGSVLRSDAVQYKLVDEHAIEVSSHPAVPLEFHVYSNYPNPFNPETCISFDLPQDEHVSIDIFDTAGKKVAILSNCDYSAGHHRIQWKAENISSGIYLYRVTAGENISVKRCSYIK